MGMKRLLTLLSAGLHCDTPILEAVFRHYRQEPPNVVCFWLLRKLRETGWQPGNASSRWVDIFHLRPVKRLIAHIRFDRGDRALLLSASFESAIWVLRVSNIDNAMNTCVKWDLKKSRWVFAYTSCTPWGFKLALKRWLK